MFFIIKFLTEFLARINRAFTRELLKTQSDIIEVGLGKK